MSQLPFGWVCFSNHQEEKECPMCETMSQLPFGWVCFSNKAKAIWFSRHKPTSQLPFGWVCFSNKRHQLKIVEFCRRLNCLSAGSVSLTPSATAEY